MRGLVLSSLCVLLTACPEVPEPEVTEEIRVGPEGGSFRRGNVTLDVPEDALVAVSILKVTTTEALPTIEGRVPISVGYLFTPQSLLFKKPVTITIHYDQTKVPSDQIDPARFDVRHKSGASELIPSLSGGATDPVARTVTGESERLGTFWATSPLPPGPATITLDPAQATLLPGSNQAFTATVMDETGAVMSNVQVGWEVYTPRMATIDQSGTVTALAPGIATVVARAGAAEGIARVFIPGQPSGATTFLAENPFPTGEDLLAGVMHEGQPLIAGGNATVLLRDGSGSWARLFSSSGVAFRTIAKVGETLVGAGSFSTTGILFEQSPTGLKTASLKDFTPRTIWFDGTHGMVAGFGNDLLVRRNGQWVEDDSPTFETVLSVKGDGAGGFIALGDLGSVFRYDPTTQAWTPLSEQRLPVLLSTAVLVDETGTEAWATGGLDLLHFQDGAWTSTPLPASPQTDEVTALGLARGRVYVATRRQGVSSIRTFDPAIAAAGGNGWVQIVTVRAPQIIRALFGDESNAFAVGDLGAIWEFDASVNLWRERSRGFYDDVTQVATGTGITVAAKRICLTAACDLAQGEVLRRTGPATWEKLGTLTFPDQILALHARSATEVYAGGVGFLLRWDGASWTDVTVQQLGADAILDLAWCGNALNAVGTSGSWWRGTTQLNRQTTLTNAQNMAVQLDGISCTAADSVFIVSPGILFENRVRQENVDNPLTPENEAGFQTGPWTRVWSPGDREAYAFGAAYYGGMWNGHDLSPLQFPAITAQSVTGLWGASVDNLYAVGFTAQPLRFGFAMRFTGVNWDWIDLGTARRPLDIEGRSPTDVFVVTEKGGILRGVPPAP